MAHESSPVGKSSLSTEPCWVSERSGLSERLEDGQNKTPVTSTTDSSKGAKCPMPPVGQPPGRLSPGWTEQEGSQCPTAQMPLLGPPSTQGREEGPKGFRRVPPESLRQEVCTAKWPGGSGRNWVGHGQGRMEFADSEPGCSKHRNVFL